MYWKTKAGIFRALSVVPFGDHIHFLLQRTVTRELPRRPEHLDQLVTAARTLHADAQGRIGEDDLGKAMFVEVGAGRDLAVAIALRLLGVGHVASIDITRLAKLGLIRHAAGHMAERLGTPAPEIRSWEDLEAFGITYRAPETLQGVALPIGSVDCFFSVDTLEHIPRESLVELFTEAGRILTSSGLSVHFIDYSDHYARNSGLSRFNFLKFTAAQWRPYNSRFHYVNRLRHSEYVALFSGQGFKVEASPDVEPPEPDILAALAPDFQGFTERDLFTTRAKIIARPFEFSTGVQP